MPTTDVETYCGGGMWHCHIEGTGKHLGLSAAKDGAAGAGWEHAIKRLLDHIVKNLFDHIIENTEGDIVEQRSYHYNVRGVLHQPDPAQR